MTTGTLKTQGTELFFVNPLDSNLSVIKFACPTGVNGLGGPADQLDDSCLDSVDRTFKRGLGNPGQVTVPFNFIPSHFSHQDVMALKEDGRNLDWLIGFSDGTAVPTLDSDGDFVPPASPLRTSVEFNGYVADVNIDIATNEIVRGTLLIQRSGTPKWNWNGPVPT